VLDYSGVGGAPLPTPGIDCSPHQATSRGNRWTSWKKLSRRRTKL